MTAKEFVKQHYPKARAERQVKGRIAGLKEVYWLIRPAIGEMYIASGKTESNAWVNAKAFISNKALCDVNFTGYYDDNKKPIFVGDKLKSKWGYEVIVVKDGDDYSGKLVCSKNHSCRNIPYHLNKGKGHCKVNT